VGKEGDTGLGEADIPAVAAGDTQKDTTADIGPVKVLHTNTEQAGQQTEHVARAMYAHVRAVHKQTSIQRLKAAHFLYTSAQKC
jgi:hypothetical protein